MELTPEQQQQLMQFVSLGPAGMLLAIFPLIALGILAISAGTAAEAKVEAEKPTTPPAQQRQYNVIAALAFPAAMVVILGLLFALTFAGH